MGQNWMTQLPPACALQVVETISEALRTSLAVPRPHVADLPPVDALELRIARLSCYSSYVSYLHTGPTNALSKALAFSARALAGRPELEHTITNDLKLLDANISKAAYDPVR